MQEDHIRKRETPLGRWFPLCIYSVNVILWVITGILAGAWNLLWLAVFPLPALGLYLLRTQKEQK